MCVQDSFDEDDDDEDDVRSHRALSAANYLSALRGSQKKMQQLMEDISARELTLFQTAGGSCEDEQTRRKLEVHTLFDILTRFIVQERISALLHDVDRLERERNELTSQLRRVDTTGKLAEERRRRLEQLEQQLRKSNKHLEENRLLQAQHKRQAADADKMRHELEVWAHIEGVIV